MPKSVTCKFSNEILDISKALTIRDDARKRKPYLKPDFRCIECGEPVRPHRGTKPAPHFEHLKRNKSCGLSHKIVL